MSCPRLHACDLPKVVTSVFALRRWQAEYCEDDFGSCERLKLADGNRDIPPGMLPNGFVLAQSA